MSYGGGAIDVTEPVVAPIQMAESRPTLIYNTITDSADAAISADPNSFLESNFHAPVFQRAASISPAITSESGRSWPGTGWCNNSINGLFIRVNTPAAGQLEPMTVSGRFDDTDVVHVLSQVLVLQGQVGGPLLLEDRPDVLSVRLTPTSGGTLTPTQSYSYRVTFVNEAGSESLASLATRSVVASAGGAIESDDLPIAPTGVCRSSSVSFHSGFDGLRVRDAARSSVHGLHR